MLDVAVIGETVADLIAQLPRRFVKNSQTSPTITLPLGEKITLEEYTLSPGGSGANVAVALKKLGLKIQLTTFLGSDQLAVSLKEELAKQEIIVETLETAQPTPISIILGVAGNRTILSSHPKLEMSVRPKLPECRYIYLGPTADLEILSAVTQTQARSSAKLCLNPGRELIDEHDRTLMQVIRTAEILILNREEALSLIRAPWHLDNTELISGLLRLGPKVVALTLGADGAILATPEFRLDASALLDRDQIANTTGAGDAFAAALLAYYYKGENDDSGREVLERAFKAAMLNSAGVLAHLGAQTGQLMSAEIERDLGKVKLKSDA